MRDLSITTLATYSLLAVVSITGLALLPEIGDSSSQQQNHQSRFSSFYDVPVGIDNVPSSVNGQDNVQTVISRLNYSLNNGGENTLTVIGGSVNETGIFIYLKQ